MSRRIASNRPHAPDASDTHARPVSDSDSSSDSDGESTRLSASFRIVSESLLRMEQTELEMAKTREALRLKAEKRRIESEVELTQMLLQTQLQIASLVSRGPDHHSLKRKRSDEKEEGKEENDSSSADVAKRIGLALTMLL